MVAATRPVEQEEAVSEEPKPRLWTRAEYHRAADLGLFGQHERLELIEGEIVQKMPPMNNPHQMGILLVSRELRRLLVQGHLRVQMPFVVGKNSEPGPDVALVEGDERDYEGKDATEALLIVEVSDSTLQYDRNTKARLYAKAGVPEYWVLNLNGRTLEVFRDPHSTPKPEYAASTLLAEQETVTPLCAPNMQITVADLLPRRKEETDIRSV